VKTDGRHGGSIHVWGGITRHNGKRLVVFNRNVNANLYVNEVLEYIVVPFKQDNFAIGNGIVQQDGARPHTSIVTPRFIADNNISQLNWASMSPDMSPIEHVWDELKRRVYDRPNPPVNVQQLKYAVIEEWNAIPPSFIANLVQSMRHRCVALINAPGAFTRY